MKIVKPSSLLIAGLAAIGLTTAAHAADTITVVSWGGAYTNSQVKAYHEPWMAKTGNKINSEDYNGGLAEVRAQVEAGNVTWDLIDVELADAVRGCDEGILETLPLEELPAGADGTPAKDDFIAGTLHECAVGEIVWSTVYAYDKTKVAAAPTSLGDFFDLAKIPGKRGLRKTPKVNLEWALMADGVPADKVYEVLATPEGVDRAFAKLDTIKGDVVWWEAGAQPPQLLADGEVVMTSAYNGRLFNAIVNEKKPFDIVWDGQVWDIDLWVMPKGTKNKAAAWDFVKFSTDTQRLADQAKYISYGPVRKSSFAKVLPEMQPHMPTAPANFKNPLQNDFGFWADYGDELNERFNAWLAG
ncbi:polyamine ABC transporter substrate-binding protein [Nisaea acidiphila]|uniref:Polyamine ABC transporter substrate-binding protein n=1 Tax=Nisaea acidiphila TaxID=1862145 RepID=A0A9J7AW11_9PROT|nr:polyamine ABC transporter substrate-binding protein [Nisaea acidiphila]UUX51496.1 polyamine ABC transporter substrate-binding protein [Nisaea acidiphila]